MSPRSRQAIEEIRVERRVQILDAAEWVLARTGLAGSRITDIAAKAGVSQGLVYHYFPEKDSLVAAVVDRAIRKSREVIGEALAKPGTPRDRLHTLYEEMLARQREEPTHLLITLQALTSGSMRRQVQEGLQRYGEPVFRDLLTLIREGQAAGQIVGEDPKKLAAVFLAVIDGMALLALQRSEAEGHFPAADLIMRIFGSEGGGEAEEHAPTVVSASEEGSSGAPSAPPRQ